MFCKIMDFHIVMIMEHILFISFIETIDYFENLYWNAPHNFILYDCFAKRMCTCTGKGFKINKVYNFVMVWNFELHVWSAL